MVHLRETMINEWLYRIHQEGMVQHNPSTYLSLSEATITSSNTLVGTSFSFHLAPSNELNLFIVPCSFVRCSRRSCSCSTYSTKYLAKFSLCAMAQGGRGIQRDHSATVGGCAVGYTCQFMLLIIRYCYRHLLNTGISTHL